MEENKFLFNKEKSIDKNKKNIYVTYCMYGNGHFSAAKAIANYLDKNKSEEYNVFFIDGIEEASKVMDTFFRTAYSNMQTYSPKLWGDIFKISEKGILNKIVEEQPYLKIDRINKIFEENKPDYIIATHPFLTNLFVKLKEKGKIDSEISVVITDYEAHKSWYLPSENILKYFIPSEKIKDEMIKDGVDEKKIVYTGIPLEYNFTEKFTQEYIEEIKEELDIKKEEKIITYFCNGISISKKNLKKVENDLIKISDILKEYQIICISGKNAKMYEKLEVIIEKNKMENVKLIAFTKRAKELMYMSEVVFTKPGGLTVAECLAMGTPIMITMYIPGQEEGNVRYIEDNKAGEFVNTENIEEICHKIKNEPEYIKELRKNALAIGNIKSTKKIIENMI